MQEENQNFNRRTFLRHSATGLVLAGSRMVLPDLASGEQQVARGDRKAPENPVMLRSSQLQVIFDAKDGVPFEYRLGDHTLRGEDFGQPVSVRICHKEPWKVSDVVVSVTHAEENADHVAFSFAADESGNQAADFTVRYSLRNTTVVVSLDGVKEHPGYELISVSLPRLVTIREEDSVGWLVHGDGGGSLAMLRDAAVGGLQPNQFWGNTLGTLPVVIVGTEHMMCVQETTAYMDSTFLNVAGSAGKKRASLGTAQMYRVDGSQCYEMNAGKDVPRNCGNARTPNLVVGQPSSCRLDFIAVHGNPEDAWLDGAKLVRSRMPEIPSHFYDDKYIYGIRCDEPLFPKPAATFAECETKIQNIAALIDQWPQIVHLWGWQFRGKDTGYPAVNEVNERIGGYDGMMHVMESGRKYNATVTISDNYDDAYRSSPAWNDNIIARRPDGQLWKSRNWTGEDSYVLGMAKFMAGPGAERVRYTCERYDLSQTTHIDVLSYFAIRNDWDPELPASGIKNLVDGRYKVLESFKAHGVDGSSEALRYPMIGHISCYWYAQGPGKCPFGGRQIPLLPLIYRNSAVWGLSGGHAPDETMTRLNELFLGASPRAVGLTNNDTKAVTDIFYLWLVPWFELHLRNIESFKRDGEKTTIGLEGNSSIEIDWAQKSHTMILDGVEVARSGQVTCPMGKDRIALYASETQTLTATLSDGWDAASLGAVAISLERRTAAQYTLRGRTVEVSVQARQPVILYKNKADMQLG
jgi:hypothetical protein